MKFGRKPRGHDSRIPQFSELLKHRTMAPLPPVVNYAARMAGNLGMMLNDTLGDWRRFT